MSHMGIARSEISHVIDDPAYYKPCVSYFFEEKGLGLSMGYRRSGYRSRFRFRRADPFGWRDAEQWPRSLRQRKIPIVPGPRRSRKQICPARWGPGL